MSNIHENNQKRRKRLTFRRFFWYNKGILLVVNGNCVFNFLQWAEERKVKVFQNGERVVCGSKGVCVVEEITTLDIAGVDKKREYYILKPLYLSSSTVYIPVDTAEGSMRKVLAHEEAESLWLRLGASGIDACLQGEGAEERLSLLRLSFAHPERLDRTGEDTADGAPLFRWLTARAAG